MRWLVAMGAIALATSAVALDDYDGSFAKLSDKTQAALTEAFDWYLFDPRTALVRNLKARPNGTICGQLNAKNEYGGYTGFRYFYVTDGLMHVGQFPETNAIGHRFKAIERGACE